MDNVFGEAIHRHRTDMGLTQDQFGARYEVTGPAIFKFEKGYVKPSLELWLRMAKDCEIPEKRAVLLWIKSRLPEEYQDLIIIEEDSVVREDSAPYHKATILDKAKRLSPKSRKIVEMYIDTLLQEESLIKRKKKKPKLNWVGALSHLKDQYTSVELQKKSLEERD